MSSAHPKSWVWICEVHWGSLARHPNLFSKLRSQCRQGGWHQRNDMPAWLLSSTCICTPPHVHTGNMHTHIAHPHKWNRRRGKRSGSSLRVISISGHISWRPQTLLYQSKAGASGYEAFCSDLAHQRHTSTPWGQWNIGQVAGVGVVVSIEDNLPHLLYSFSPCFLLENWKPSTSNLLAASYNYVIDDELTGV